MSVKNLGYSVAEPTMLVFRSIASFVKSAIGFIALWVEGPMVMFLHSASLFLGGMGLFMLIADYDKLAFAGFPLLVFGAVLFFFALVWIKLADWGRR